MIAPVIAPILVGAEVGGLVLSAIAKAVKALYGMAEDINDYLDRHIEDMKRHENPTISRTGRVLEMAKLGFGIGYITAVVVIAAGQLLLGNPLSAAATVATAATLTNPIAMTCAAIGAIYFGWSALSDVERNEILEKLSKGLEVGIELIKSIVRFVVDGVKELLNSKNFEEIKKYVGSAAAVFGKTLGDVTHKVSDVVSDTFDVFKKKSGEAIHTAFDAATDAYHSAAEGATSASRAIGETADKAVGVIRERLEKPASKVEKKGD